MKEWKEYLFKVNGFEMTAVYNEDTIQKVFLLIKQLQQLQKEKRNGSLYLWQHRRLLEKTTLCEFLEYLSKTRSRVLQTFKH